MLRFGEEQPAFDEDAEHSGSEREPRGYPACCGHRQAKRREQARDEETRSQCDRAQLAGRLEREHETHLMGQVVLFGVRLLERAHGA